MTARALLGPARRARSAYRRIARRRAWPKAPTNGTSFGERAEPSALVTDVFDRIRHLPGWFNIDDCAHFSLILSMQSATGCTGDIFEIGSYHGRSTCLLAYHLVAGERLVVCDVFDAPGADRYDDPPSVERLRANLRLVNPALADGAVEIRAGRSDQLDLASDRRFRFAHIDGGHDRQAALGDLRLCAAHLLPGGVIAVDDYRHRDFPEVTTAVDEFLAERPDIGVLADLNRHGADGRKIYLIGRRGAVAGS